MSSIPPKDSASTFVTMTHYAMCSKMKELDLDELFAFLDCTTPKIRKAAVAIIAESDYVDQLADYTLRGNVVTTAGKTAVLGLMNLQGKKHLAARDVYMHLLCDTNKHVVHGALWGLVFWQDELAIEAIEDAKRKSRNDNAMYDLAIESINQSNPFLFSPYYRDAGDVWGLDKSRFGDRIGLA